MHNVDIAKTRDLAAQGDADAQYKLGEHYSYKDEELAIEWYRKAAEQGHVNAQYALSHELLSEMFRTKAETVHNQ